MKHHTHYSEMFRIFSNALPFLTERQKTFQTTCDKRYPTDRYSENPTCPDCIKILQEEAKMAKEVEEMLKNFKRRGELV